MKEKLINFRPIFIISLNLGLGIFFASLIIKYSLSFLWLLIIVPFLILLVVLIRKKNVKQIVCVCLCIVISLFVGVVSYVINFKSFTKEEFVEGNYITIGTLKQKRVYNDYSVFEIENVNISAENTSITLKYKLNAYYYGNDNEDYEIGDKVFINANIKTVSNKDINRYMFEGVKYTCSITNENIKFYQTTFSPFSSVRATIYKTLFSNIEKEEAGISYALLTGDSCEIENDTLANFRYGGIAHIFAVSGLHIGLIAQALLLVLKKFKLNPWVVFAVTSIFIILYAGVCNFSTSSLRAVVMCIVLMFTKATGFKYDKLNSLSFACALLLLINPLSVFSVGFQLSVSATGGVVILMPKMKQLLSKLPPKLCDSLALILSVQLFTIPIILDCFRYISILSVLTNFIFIPIISIMFIVLFVATLLAICLPFIASVILYLPMYFVKLVKVIINFIDYSKLLITGFEFGAFISTYYLALFTASDKVNLKIVAKSNTVFALLFITIFGVCLF